MQQKYINQNQLNQNQLNQNQLNPNQKYINQNQLKTNNTMTRIQLNPKNNMTSVIRYDVNYFTSIRNTVRKPLPESVMKMLNIQTKIKATMSDNDLKKFTKVIDNFNVEELQKKINSLLNKLSKANFLGIYQQVGEILKNRKVLIQYTIKNLMNKAIVQTIFGDLYAEFYKKLYNEKTKEIFDETFTELLEVLKGTTTVVEDNNFEQLCVYMKDKTKFNGLFLFLASLYNSKIMKKEIILENIKYLETTIFGEGTELNDKYCEAYTKFLTKLNKKEFINLEKINMIKKQKISMRIKFGLMDLQDFRKSLN